MVEHQLGGDLYEVMADPYFARDIIQESDDIVVRDPPEFKDLLKVGQLCGTELYVHPVLEFEQGSLEESNQHNAHQLHDFLHLMQGRYLEQAQCFLKSGDQISADICSASVSRSAPVSRCRVQVSSASG